MTIHAYIDSDIVINFCWAEQFGRGIRKKSNTYKLFEKAAGGVFEGYVSTLTAIEITHHFNNWFLLEKNIKDGHSHHEFNSNRHSYSVNDKDRKEIKEIVEWLKREDMGLNFIEIKQLSEDFFKYVSKYIEGCAEPIDAIHLRIALDVNCDYFITKDADLRKRIQDMIDNKILKRKIRPAKVDGFLSVLEKEGGT